VRKTRTAISPRLATRSFSITVESCCSEDRIDYRSRMEPLTLHLPQDPAALATLRRSVREWLETLEIVDTDVAAIVAAISEVAADAVEAGPVEVHGVLAGGDVVMRCRGSPEWRIEDHPSRYVAALLVDDVAIEQTADASAIVLRKAASRGLR
jgi:hypothetical protein